jgi:hypothetical protein
MAKLDISTPLLDARSEYVGDFKVVKHNREYLSTKALDFKKQAEALEVKMEEAAAKNSEIKEIKKLTKWFKGIEDL